MGFRLCDILRHLAKDPPTEDAERKELYNAAVELMYSVESAQDTAQRLYHGHIPLALAQMGIDLKIFNLLAQEPDTKWTATQLAFSTGANSVLLRKSTISKS